ncbi:sodium/glutamate symporter [Hutsoniella sourekii]
MITIQLNLIQTMGLAVLTILFGRWLGRKFPILEAYSLPAAITGGLFFAVINMFLRLFNLVNFELDTSLSSFFMVIYFTTIGFDASFQALLKSKNIVIKFLLISVIAIIVQNILAISLGSLLGIEPLIALLLGSPSMVGGPGTAAAVSPTIADLGFSSATSVGVIAATMGIIMGSVSGGPIGSSLVQRYQLSSTDLDASAQRVEKIKIHEEVDYLTTDRVAKMIYLTFICMFLGTYLTELINWGLGFIASGMSFPVYIGPMIIASIVRNISDNREHAIVDKPAINVGSTLALNLFLSLTMVSLELWTVLEIALPMLLVLLAEMVVTLLFAWFIVYRLMGKNYDAAVMTAGFAGFGMGSSSNAMA